MSKITIMLIERSRPPFALVVPDVRLASLLVSIDRDLS
jgi:hypothetical protein